MPLSKRSKLISIGGLALCAACAPLAFLPTSGLQQTDRRINADGRFDARLVAQAGTDVIDGFGPVEDLYLYGFSAGAAPEPGLAFIPEVMAVQPGDLITLAFENRLPCNPERPEGTYGVSMSQTNIHTHGMIVSPDDGTDGSYGDYVFVLAETGTPPGDGVDACSDDAGHAGHDHTDGAIPYAIKVPADHPPGVYWFHPHAHGVSQQQIARGLAGLITVGDIWDYAWIECQLTGEGVGNECASDDEAARETALRSRTAVDFVVLKDVQVERDANGPWRAVEWYDPGFCGDDDYPVLVDGACASEDSQEGEAGEQQWLVTVNGAIQPALKMENDRPQILRLANLSASFVYNLEFKVGEQLIPFQIIANDGVHVGQDAEAGVMADGDILLFPSARIEIYLDRGDICAAIGDACDGSDVTVVVENVKWECPDGDPMSCGDFWPIGRLMTIEIEGLDQAEPALPLAVESSPIFDSLDDAIPVAAQSPGGLACSDGTQPGPALSRGEFRTIAFWNGDVDEDETFTMRTDMTPQRSVPAFDQPEDMTADWLAANGFDEFDHMRTDLCIVADRIETWVVQNISDEFHNFHVHQSKFAVLEVSGSAGTTRDNGDTVLHDNYPVPPGEWIKVRVRFTEEVVGRFVYHCHILEHEDKGMMSVIEVVAEDRRQGLLDRLRSMMHADADPAVRQAFSVTEADICRAGAVPG